MVDEKEYYGEEWKPISDIDELSEFTKYSISNYGRIRGKVSFVKGFPNKGNGHIQMMLNCKGSDGTHKVKLVTVKNCVAKLFVPNDDPNLDCVGYKDGDMNNLHYDNLYWKSKSRKYNLSQGIKYDCDSEVVHYKKRYKVKKKNKLGMVVEVHDGFHVLVDIMGYDKTAILVASRGNRRYKGYYWEVILLK